MLLTDSVPSPVPRCLVEISLPSSVFFNSPVKVLSTVTQSEPPSVFARTMIFLTFALSALQASSAFSSRFPSKTEISVSEIPMFYGISDLTS